MDNSTAFNSVKIHLLNGTVMGLNTAYYLFLCQLLIFFDILSLQFAQTEQIRVLIKFNKKQASFFQKFCTSNIILTWHMQMNLRYYYKNVLFFPTLYKDETICLATFQQLDKKMLTVCTVGSLEPLLKPLFMGPVPSW